MTTTQRYTAVTTTADIEAGGMCIIEGLGTTPELARSNAEDHCGRTHNPEFDILPASDRLADYVERYGAEPELDWIDRNEDGVADLLDGQLMMVNDRRPYRDTVRNRLLERIAIALYGVASEDTAIPMTGWRALLARQLGMNKNGVLDTMKQETSDKFDRRLADFISQRRVKMTEELGTLAYYESRLRGDERTALTLFLVNYSVRPSDHGSRLMWASSAGEVAAFMVKTFWPSQAQHAEIAHNELYAVAEHAGCRIEVTPLPLSDWKLTGELLSQAKELLARTGRKLGEESAS